ncbi:protein-L-isoaspartate O-methyltransferase [Lysobacter sp. H23M47]|uniref:protein-L-isoaspartate O-methyltransferase family protein n=1 Tax=Lysobacter sp. H23M47 TaxID=2781024 RepID=UPI00187E8C5B|nr:protein-L-isoaspartate O-methyltransferase [Lysobacter sp. H23M47]QOW24924.1 protein-L-isoaspartate O-methyltransferase [Lysobacter sp. H23M47]
MSMIDYAAARDLMVEQQIRPWNVLDARVLDVLATMPREPFVPAAHRNLAYADTNLPLPQGQVMLKPVIQGRILQSLLLQPDEDVLEIGTGSGYLTACLSRLARDVVSIEKHAELAGLGLANLTARAIANVEVVHADAFSYRPARQFDAVCVTGAVDTIPMSFLEWLKPGGRMLVVRGRPPVMEAVVVHVDVNGSRIESLFETDIPYLAGAAPVPAFEF